mmetsp:Transcript_39383/g.63073  ORF Transcript_39383/g.63073 Transcript_39383/m.63073 type:complete len:127 (-) Transcript_39383:341-721(-)
MKTKPDSRLMMMTSLLGRVSAKASIQFEKRTLNGVRFSPKMSIKSCGNEEPKDQEKVNIIANSHRRDTLAAEAVNTPSILQQANFQIEDGLPSISVISLIANGTTYKSNYHYDYNAKALKLCSSLL